MEITFAGKKAKYIELYDAIVAKINNGELKANEKLPSKRTLAINLNVSINTIMNAYDLLLDEGYIQSVEKKGYFVNPQLIMNKKPTLLSSIEKKGNPYLYDFTTQSIEEFNNTKWKTILRQEISKTSYINKTESLGDIGLRKIIAAHLKENRGIFVDPKQILIGNGLEMLERILKISDIHTLTLENPGYHKLDAIAKNVNMEVKYIDLDDQGVLVPNETCVLYTTPFNQYPTGIKMSITRKKELIQFLEATSSYIIEDDFDAEFRINSSPSTALYSLYPDRVIFFSTFTETLFPGLRISYTILPNTLLPLYLNHYSVYSSMVPSLEQFALREFIREGFYESHINRLKRKYIERRKYILSLLKDDSRFEVDEKKNYLSLLLKVKTALSDQELKEKLEAKKIKILFLSDFDIHNKNSHTLILGYTAIRDEEIKKGLEVIKNCI